MRRFLARVAAIEADAGRPWDDETLRRRAGQVKAKIAAGRQVVAWRAEIAQLAERVVAARAGAGTWTGAGPGALADEVRIAVQRWPADQERFGLCRMFEEFLQDLALAREAGQRAGGFEQDARAAVSLVKAGAPDSGAVQRFLARIAAIEADAGRPWDDETLRRRAGLVKAEIASARQVAATTSLGHCCLRDSCQVRRGRRWHSLGAGGEKGRGGGCQDRPRGGRREECDRGRDEVHRWR